MFPLHNHEWLSLLMQEIELERDFNCELMSIPGYMFEAEKSRKGSNSYEGHESKPHKAVCLLLVYSKILLM